MRSTCADYLNDDYSSQFCPCGPGLIEKDGMCVVAPARPSAPTVTPSTALMDTPMNGPDVPNGTRLRSMEHVSSKVPLYNPLSTSSCHLGGI